MTRAKRFRGSPCLAGDHMRQSLRHGRPLKRGSASFLHRGFHPLQIAAGIVDQDCKSEVRAAPLRQAAAASFIGHGTSPKRLPATMGHGSIQMATDLQGYLSDLRDDDRAGMRRLGARLRA